VGTKSLPTNTYQISKNGKTQGEIEPSGKEKRLPLNKDGRARENTFTVLGK